jgi:hypothetical protein
MGQTCPKYSDEVAGKRKLATGVGDVTAFSQWEKDPAIVFRII